QRMIARHGRVNALSQTLLKLTMPGVPDTYQGTEIWDFSLVDPDNRRPVDYERRSAMLDDLARRGEAASDDPLTNGLRIITMIRPPSWAATNVPKNEETMLTIQPSTPRLFVHASWIATPSAAAKKASAITIGPPTLDSGIAPLT
ncbi:MAG: hypothetical protein J0I08_04595, partial [Rhizobiales bacterium]|nr:hypothetical protein [Hyphomicrobiales bacterium]